MVRKTIIGTVSLACAILFLQYLLRFLCWDARREWSFWFQPMA